MAKTNVTIEVEETGADEWTATNPITGKVKKGRTKWAAVKEIVDDLVNQNATGAAVRMHGQGK